MWYHLQRRLTNRNLSFALWRLRMEIADGNAYLDQVKQMIIQYTNWLGRDLSFQNLEDELRNLEGKYMPPEGEILVSAQDGAVCGMVAYHRHSDIRCEMKRLYVDPKARGQNLGDKLVTAIIAHARKAGYREMVLDTIQPLKAAIQLYKKHGFQECPPYYKNPMEDVIYMKLDL